ncbi:MAG: AMP-binding protein, partial [Bacteroidota bacterium]
MNKKSTLDIEALGANQNVVSRAYWKSRLSSFTFNSYFTSAAKSTQSQDSNKKNATFEASAETFELLDQFAKSPKAKHLILLSTLGLLANRCSGLNDIGVVTPNYLEDKEANNLLIRLNDFTGLNLPEWLTALKVSYFEDLGHGDYPISKVLEDSNSDFILGVRMDGVNHSFSEGGLLPTMIFSFEADNNLKLTIDYDEKYFDASIIAVLAKGFYNLLSNIIQNKEEIVGKAEMIGGLEKELLLQQFDRSLIEYPSNETLHGLFEKQVLINPDKTAVIFKNHNLSYGELNDRSNQLAKVLNHKGVERDTIVGLLTDRSIDTVIGMLAILKAGGAYLPIDVDYPEERKEYIIKDSGIKLLLTSSEVAEQNKYDLVTVTFDEAQDLDSDFNELANINEAGDLCYVLYTSGTTGNPKGVMVEHRNVVRLFFNEECQFDFNADDVWTMFHSHCFDFSVWEMYGALLFGGKLVIVPKIEAKDTQAFYNIIKEQGVTVLNQT